MKVEIEFVRDIVGYDLETIQQMYNDWNNLPSLKVRAKSSVNVEAEVIRRRDGKKFSKGDKIKIHTLITEIKDFNITNKEIFASTEYGDFNIDIIEGV